MATPILLGPSGSEVLLPPVNWIGEPGEYPESFTKNYDSATMLDGRIRYNFQSHSQRSWSLEWAWLDKADIDSLQALADMRQSLNFKHGMMPWTTYATVAVKSFSYSVLMATVRLGQPSKYKASMTLGEES
jgi:hypothetical protein